MTTAQNEAMIHLLTLILSLVSAGAPFFANTALASGPPASAESGFSTAESGFSTADMLGETSSDQAQRIEQRRSAYKVQLKERASASSLIGRYESSLS